MSAFSPGTGVDSQVSVQGLAMLPELTTLQQGSVPASAGSTFSAAASSPAVLRVQVSSDPSVRQTAVLCYVL